MQRHFHEELDALKQTLLAMGGLVEDQIRRVMRALLERDSDLAQEVIDRDRQVNAYDVEIDEKCVELLALHQPTAGDLRFITTAMKIVTDLERIGDQAVNVAKMQQVTRDLPANETILQQIGEMGHIVVEMVRVAMDALRRRDLELSLRLPKMDDPVDRLNRNMHFEVAKLADEPRALEWGMHMNLAARALERVGDNAVDIGEQVAFLVSGEFREFTDASHPGGVASDAT